MIFTSSKCVFQDCFTGRMIGHASEKEGFYFLEAKSDEYDSIPLSYLSEEHANNKTQVWLSHFRLGHLSFSSLKRMFPTMFGKLDIQSFHCYVCEFTKHHHVSFPSRTNKCSIPFSLIHTDVWGLTWIWSIYGAKWFVSFIDDAQGLHGYFLWNTNLMLALCFPFFIKW